MPLYICGFLVLGASFQKHLSVGALIMGWGIAELAIMINTVAVCAYCFPQTYPVSLLRVIILQMHIVTIASQNTE